MSVVIKLKEMNMADKSDRDFILETINKYYPKSPFPPTEEFLKRTFNVYFKAYVGKDVIGMTGYTPKTTYLVETIKTIVFDSHRGLGLGKALSQAIEDECKKRGINKVMTSIYSFNHAMITIKMKQGYTIEGYHPDHEKPGLHEYTLGKHI